MRDSIPMDRRGEIVRRLSAHAIAIATIACAANATAERTNDPIGVSVPLAQYRLDPLRSGVTFDVANAWHSNLTMRFSRMRAQLDGFQGYVDAHVTVTIDATSLEAKSPFVAGIVGGDDMLDVAHYPVIRFVSTRFVRTGTITGLLTGDLTIRTTTRPVTLAVTFDKDRPGSRHVPGTLAFSADGHFSWAAFGLSKWSSAVGDDVHMKIQADFVR